MSPAEPILTAGLFLPLHHELMVLLRGLSSDDWNRPTVCSLWSVRDIAAHLLDGDIRRLSFQRDGAPLVTPELPIESYADLVGFLNRLNADWVDVARRMSPQVIVEFTDVTGPEVAELFGSLDPFAPAFFSVAWAGEEQSLNWLDVARDYTEKWHHQQQIRDAVGAPGLTDRRWLYPVIDTFVRALPHACRNVVTSDEVRLVVDITGDAGGVWTLVIRDDERRLFVGRGDDADCVVTLSQDTAWRLWTKGITREEGAARAEITGNRMLGDRVLGMLSVMA